MKILILGWARLSLQQNEGSGSNLSASELAAALVERGHRVEHLRSGITYSLRRGLRIRPLETWRGVRSFDLVNSPNLATGNYNLRNVEGQRDHAEQCELVTRFVARREPDVVHIQSLEGYPLSIIAAIRALGIRVVVTPHNYYALCPQIDLLHQEREICTDYHGGLKCPDCLWHAPQSNDEFTRRRKRGTVDRWLGAGAFDSLRRARTDILAELRGEHAVPQTISHPLIAPPPLPTPPPDAMIRLRVLESASVSPHHRVANAYGARRMDAVAALNAASAIACPSRFLLDVHRAMGVNDAGLVHVPLGQPHFDALRELAQGRSDFSTPRPPATPERPLRMRFFGNCYPLKGLATLIAAAGLVPSELHSLIRLHIHAGGGRGSGDTPSGVSPLEESFRAATRHLPWVTFEGGYDIADLPMLMSRTDLTLFPNAALENSPFVVLESLHAGVPVLASDLGASPEFVHAGNGGLVAANDPAAWADAIGEWARRAMPSPRIVQECSPLRTFSQYVGAMERLLRGD